MNEIQALTLEILEEIWLNKSQKSNTPYKLVKLRHLAHLTQILNKSGIIQIHELSVQECGIIAESLQIQLKQNEISKQFK